MSDDWDEDFDNDNAEDSRTKQKNKPTEENDWDDSGGDGFDDVEDIVNTNNSQNVKESSGNFDNDDDFENSPNEDGIEEPDYPISKKTDQRSEIGSKISQLKSEGKSIGGTLKQSSHKGSVQKDLDSIYQKRNSYVSNKANSREADSQINQKDKTISQYTNKSYTKKNTGGSLNSNLQSNQNMSKSKTNRTIGQNSNDPKSIVKSGTDRSLRKNTIENNLDGNYDSRNKIPAMNTPG